MAAGNVYVRLIWCLFTWVESIYTGFLLLHVSNSRYVCCC